MGQLVVDNDKPPIFIGAGVGKDEEALGSLIGADVVGIVIGSFTEQPWAGNDAGGTLNVEHWDEQGGAYFNSIGLKNVGRVAASEHLPALIHKLQAVGQLAIVSVTTLKGEDPAAVLPGLVKWAVDIGAAAVEINGSCPNQSSDHPLLCADVAATQAAIRAVREVVGSDPYIILKVSPLDEATIRQYCTEGLAVNAIDTTNTLGNQSSPINPATGKPFIQVNDGLAGKSGPAIRDLSRLNLSMWVRLGDNNKAARQFDILSLGGVIDGTEAAERIRMGALLVGGVQAFRRSDDRAGLARQWAEQYTAAKKAVH